MSPPSSIAPGDAHDAAAGPSTDMASAAEAADSVEPPDARRLAPPRAARAATAAARAAQHTRSNSLGSSTSPTRGREARVPMSARVSDAAAQR
jgi:hypothetical protein